MLRMLIKNLVLALDGRDTQHYKKENLRSSNFTPLFESTSSTKSASQSTMVFKIAASLIALATIVTAASAKRVACPDGKNFATNEAVSDR